MTPRGEGTEARRDEGVERPSSAIRTPVLPAAETIASIPSARLTIYAHLLREAWAHTKGAQEQHNDPRIVEAMHLLGRVEREAQEALLGRLADRLPT